MLRRCRLLRTIFAILALVPAITLGQARLVELRPCSAQSGRVQAVELVGTGLDAAKALFGFDPLLSLSGAGRRWSITPAASAVGVSDLWAVTSAGISNPRRLAISPLPQILEKESNDTSESAQDVVLPLVVHGRIEPAVDLDWFVFKARSGDRVVVTCRSLSLDGQIEPALSVFDSHGRQLAHDDGGARDGQLCFVAPGDGHYLVRVQERAYRQPKANFYALSIETGPVVVAAFPSVLTRGQSQRVTLYGYNLEPPVSGSAQLQQTTATIAAPTEGDPDGGGWLPASAATVDGFRYYPAQASGSVRFDLVDGDVQLELPGDNNSGEHAQPVSIPAEIAGRFAEPRDVDWYRFAARKGQRFWIEATGQTAGEPMDLDITVRSAQGKVLTTLADTPQPKEKESPAWLPLDTPDPAGKFKVPEDGDYLVVIRDLYGPSLSGRRRNYHLSVVPQREAVWIVAKADSLAIKPGKSATLQLAAIRRGGHTAPIRIRAEKLPAGLSARETTLAAKESSGSITFSAAPGAAPLVAGAELVAETELEGRTARVPVRIVAAVDDGTSPRVRRCDGLPIAIIGK